MDEIKTLLVLMLVSQVFNAFGILCHLVWHECEDKRQREERQRRDGECRQ